MKDQLLERVVCHPKVMLGKPVIRGTRIPVDVLLRMIAQRIPEEDILKEYPRLGLTYAACSLANEESGWSGGSWSIERPMSLEPLYTPDNTTFCGPLRWGLTVFWRTPISTASWLVDLAEALEPDGVHLLGHRFAQPGISQFALSTLAATAPVFLVQRVKGRLQYLVRASLPRALQRNYALRSFGPANRTAVEGYIAGQIQRHPMADARAQTILERVQFHFPEVDLSQPRKTAHAVSWYNLHVVLVHQERWREVREEVLVAVSSMIERVCRAKAYALARAAILSDHIHLAIGCPMESSPAEIALAFLNNLAFVHGMKPVFQYGAFVGTFGEYHDGAVTSDATGQDTVQ